MYCHTRLGSPLLRAETRPFSSKAWECLSYTDKNLKASTQNFNTPARSRRDQQEKLTPSSRRFKKPRKVVWSTVLQWVEVSFEKWLYRCHCVRSWLGWTVLFLYMGPLLPFCDSCFTWKMIFTFLVWDSGLCVSFNAKTKIFILGPKIKNRYSCIYIQPYTAITRRTISIASAIWRPRWWSRRLRDPFHLVLSTQYTPIFPPGGYV